jgi:hypothetical protein
MTSVGVGTDGCAPRWPRRSGRQWFCISRSQGRNSTGNVGDARDAPRFHTSILISLHRVFMRAAACFVKQREARFGSEYGRPSTCAKLACCLRPSRAVAPPSTTATKGCAGLHNPFRWCQTGIALGFGALLIPSAISKSTRCRGRTPAAGILHPVACYDVDRSGHELPRDRDSGRASG